MSRAPLEEAWTVEAHVRFAAGLSAPGLLVVERDGFACALEPLGGEPAWTYPWRSFGCALHEDRVLAWVGADELHAIDLGTGRTVEVLHCPGGHCLSPDVEVAGDVLLVRVHEGEHTAARLFAVDLVTGRRLWSIAADDFRVQAADGEVFTANLGPAEAPEHAGFEARIGRELWRSDGHWMEPPAVKGDVAIGRLSGEGLLAEDLRSGEVLWSREPLASPGVLFQDRYHGCHGGAYEIVDAESGRLVQRWDLIARMPRTLRTGLSVPGAPILVTETHLFTGTRKNLLLAFTRDECVYAGRWALRGQLACRDGRVYVADGPRLTCLQPKVPKGRKKKR